MIKLVQAFIEHLKEAIGISETASLKKPNGNIQNVLILGMGGSGIGGSIAAQVLMNEIKVPILSSKDYSIPAFVSENTLVIASSYSGNTEETLAALEKAEKHSSKIVCICSGGQILEHAEKMNYDRIVIPGGMPPRAALGYSFPQLFTIFSAYGLIDWNIRAKFEPAIQLLTSNLDSIRQEAKEIAIKIKDKLPIIYSVSAYEAVSIRFRQQINENAKKLCWHHAFPEMNHNELVGWRTDSSEKAVLILRNESDLPQNQKRMELSKDIFIKYNPTIIEIMSKGKNSLERSLYLIHLCDWISVEIAELNHTDSVEIEVINYFKSELAKNK